MKRIAIALLALAVGLAGCAKKTAPVPLPAWAPNAQVAEVAAMIDAGTAVVKGYEQDQLDCFVTPTLTKCPGVSNAGIHAAVQVIQKALTIAKPEYNKWEIAVRANPDATEPANLAAAISTIQTTLAQLPTLKK